MEPGRVSRPLVADSHHLKWTAGSGSSMESLMRIRNPAHQYPDFHWIWIQSRTFRCERRRPDPSPNFYFMIKKLKNLKNCKLFLCSSLVSMKDLQVHEKHRLCMVPYGVGSPKFIWAPYSQLYGTVLIGWDPATSPSPSPRIWAHIRRRYWSAKIDDISVWPPDEKPLAS